MNGSVVRPSYVPQAPFFRQKCFPWSVIALSHNDSMTLLSVLRSTAKELYRNLKVEYHHPAKQQRKKPGGIKGSGEWPKHEGKEETN